MIESFTDPILRAPMIASMLMCLASSLIGVLIFLRKRSLLAETLAHATYPGVATAICIAGFFSFEVSSFFILGGAFVSALLGFGALEFLEKKGKLKEDSALTFVLASFFGIGVTIASFIQSSFPREWQRVHAYLYGQVATMTDLHIIIYALFAALIILAIFLFYKELKVFLFDRNFAVTSKISIKKIEILFVFLVVFAVVVAMRSVGLVLISAMLIAPAVFARAFTDNLKKMLFIAGAMAMVSAFFGNYLSLHLSSYYEISFPTGPLIVLISATASFLALLLAPKRGLLLRYFRILHFQSARLRENLVKMLWRMEEKPYSLSEIAHLSGASLFALFFALLRLRLKGTIEKNEKGFLLTAAGRKWGAKIIRFHRLWEVYLVDYLGVSAQRVHKSAEEIEHILTPDLEKALIELLDDPKHDPHDQPIPPKEEGITYA